VPQPATPTLIFTNHSRCLLLLFACPSLKNKNARKSRVSLQFFERKQERETDSCLVCPVCLFQLLRADDREHCHRNTVFQLANQQKNIKNLFSPRTQKKRLVEENAEKRGFDLCQTLGKLYMRFSKPKAF